ncbi:MAG: hypothetical protein KAS32_04800, partial [Candidatus Peribacteraceae bacterium]|nr:hypothetical protein [Candidatus Peribacteraceae bacterium]
MGNESNVTRIGSNSTVLSVMVRDLVDNTQVVPPSFKRFWITTNQTNYGAAIATTSSASGFMNLTFDPDCTYAVGEQLWKAGIAGHTNYYDGNSTDHIVYIYSQMYINITHPDNMSFDVATSPVINGTIIDECEPVPYADVLFRAIDQYGTPLSPPSPDPADNFTGGIYNSTQSLGGADNGLDSWYNITMNASLAYYNDTYILAAHKMRVANEPDLSSPEVSPSGDGWGYNYSFNVTLNDQDLNDIVNVSFWTAPDSSGPWTFRNSQNWTSDQNDNEFQFWQAFICADYTAAAGALYYKYNVTDEVGFTATTADSNFMTMQKDDIDFQNSIGDGITINREGSATGTIGFQIFDDDEYSKAILGSGVPASFWVTIDSSNYGPALQNNTNASGYVIYNFEPDCNYEAGSQQWYGGTDTDTCYKAINQTPGSQGLTIRGQLKNNIERPNSTETEFNVTNQIFVRFNISTDCATEGILNESTATVTLIHNQTGATSSCVSVEDELDGWYNCTWDSTGEPEGNWSVNVSTILSDYNSNTTVWLNMFFLDNIEQSYSEAYVEPSAGGWGTTYTYNITLNDPESDTIECTLYTNTTGSGWINRGTDIVSGSGNCSIIVTNFNYSDVGQTQFRFVINDTFNTLETPNYTGPAIDYDNVTIVHFQGNATNVNRSGTQATLLMVRVNDTDIGQPTTGINTTFWTVYTAGLSDFDNGSVNITNATGHVFYNFNPNCSYDVGIHEWKSSVTDTRYNLTNISESLEVNITGDLIPTITNPVGGLAGVYLRDQNITLRGTLESDCVSEDMTG